MNTENMANNVEENPFSQLHIQVIGSLWAKEICEEEFLPLNKLKKQQDCEKHHRLATSILQMMMVEKAERGYIIGNFDDLLVVTSDEYSKKISPILLGEKRLWNMNGNKISGVSLEKNESALFHCYTGRTTYIATEDDKLTIITSSKQHGMSLSDELMYTGNVKTMSFNNDILIRKDSKKDRGKNIIMITRQA